MTKMNYSKQIRREIYIRPPFKKETCFYSLNLNQGRDTCINRPKYKRQLSSTRKHSTITLPSIKF